MPSSMCKMRSFRSSCASAKYHPGLCYSFVNSVICNDSVSGNEGPDQTARNRRLIWAFAVRMFHFSLGAANLFIYLSIYL